MSISRKRVTPTVRKDGLSELEELLYARHGTTTYHAACFCPDPSCGDSESSRCHGSAAEITVMRLSPAECGAIGQT